MRVVIQRVSEAKVSVDDKVVGEINSGIMALVGFEPTDNQATMSYTLNKILDLRIFEDEQDKMNLSLRDVEGGLLVVPNFTLYGDCRKGRRPGYSGGAPVNQARDLFDKFIAMAKDSYNIVESGIFQADMKVTLVNDGPVTLLIDSSKLF